MSDASVVALELCCPDPELTAAFYIAAFDARVSSSHELLLGAQCVRLRKTRRSILRPPSGPATSFQHFAIVVSDIAAAMARLESLPGWKPISTHGPQKLPDSSGGVTAFKFRDIDGHPLELLAFPPTQVPPAWHDRPGLFCGIDHTAISVLHTAPSVAFWRKFGFEPSGTTLNEGLEQARLDGVEGAIVEVTRLEQPGAGPPHLELLCYRQPPAFEDRLGPDEVLSTRVVLSTTDHTRDALCDPDGHRLAFT